MLLPKAWLSDYATSRSMRYQCWVSLAPYAHLTKLSSRLRPMPFFVQLQDRTTLYFLTFWEELALCVALVLTEWGSTLSALRLAIELLHSRPRLTEALRKSQRLEGITAFLFSLSLLTGSKDFLHLVAPRTLSILFVAWTMIASLMRSPQDKKQKLATGFLRDKLYGQDFAGPISYGPPKFCDQSVVIELRTSCTT